MGGRAQAQGRQRGRARHGRASGNGGCEAGGGGGQPCQLPLRRLSNHKCAPRCADRGMRVCSGCRARCHGLPLLDTGAPRSTHPAAPSGRCSEPCNALEAHAEPAIRAGGRRQGGEQACERQAPHSHACSADASPQRRPMVAKRRMHAVWRCSSGCGVACCATAVCTTCDRCGLLRTCSRLHSCAGR